MGNRMKESKSNTPGGILVRLKNKLCLAMGIDSHRLRIMIDRYVMKQFNGVVNSKAHFDKVNAYNELTRDEMTIKVLFKFLTILSPKSVKISLEVTTRSNDTYKVSEEIKFLTSIEGNKENE